MTKAPMKTDRKFTYKDYLSWDDGERWELIDGEAYNMTPGPGRAHQEISGAIFNIIYSYLKDKPCKVYTAPFDVILSEQSQNDDEIYTVVQPDILVVCDKSKLDDKGCKGTPDLIVEIVSPSSSQRDLKDKFYLYERFGVKEYWIVDPVGKTAMVFKLNEKGEYGKPDMYISADTIKVGIFEDLEIDMNTVFAD